jgi:hypothetical protein
MSQGTTLEPALSAVEGCRKGRQKNAGLQPPGDVLSRYKSIYETASRKFFHGPDFSGLEPAPGTTAAGAAGAGSVCAGIV